MRNKTVELTINATGHLQRELSLNLSIAKGSGNRPTRAPSNLAGIHVVCFRLDGRRAHTQFIHLFTAWLSPAFHEFPTIHFGHNAPPVKHPTRKKNTRQPIRLTMVFLSLI
jgi:hypothetical protein